MQQGFLISSGIYKGGIKMDGNTNDIAKAAEKEIQKKYGAALSVRLSKKKTSLNLYYQNKCIGNISCKKKHVMQDIMDDAYKIIGRMEEKHANVLKKNTRDKAQEELKAKFKKYAEEELSKTVTVNRKTFVRDAGIKDVFGKLFQMDGIITVTIDVTGCHYAFAEEDVVKEKITGIIEGMPFKFHGNKEQTEKFYRKRQVEEWKKLNKQWLTRVSDSMLAHTYKSAKVISLNPVTIEYNIGKYIIGKGWSFCEDYKDGMKILEEARKNKACIPDKPEYAAAECIGRKLIYRCYRNVYEYDMYGWKKNGIKGYFKNIRNAFDDASRQEGELSAYLESSFIAQALYGFVQENKRFVTVKDAVKELRGLKHTGKTIYKESSENGIYNLLCDDDIMEWIERLETACFFRLERMYWKYGSYYAIHLVKDVKFGTEIKSNTFYDDIVNEKPVPDTVALQFFDSISGKRDTKAFMDCLHLLKYKGFICRYQEQYTSFMKSAPKEVKQYLQMQKELSDGFEKRILTRILKK